MSPFIALLAFDAHEKIYVSTHSLLFLSCSHHCFRGNMPNYFSDQYTSCIPFTEYTTYFSVLTRNAHRAQRNTGITAQLCEDLRSLFLFSHIISIFTFYIFIMERSYI